MDRDRNTVVKALECSANGAVNCFNSSCFYHEPGCACDRSQIMLDALALLKDQDKLYVDMVIEWLREMAHNNYSDNRQIIFLDAILDIRERAETGLANFFKDYSKIGW